MNRLAHIPRQARPADLSRPAPRRKRNTAVAPAVVCWQCGTAIEETDLEALKRCAELARAAS